MVISYRVPRPRDGDGPEPLAHEVKVVAPVAKQGLEAIGPRVRREVQVVRRPAQKGVTHRTPYEVELVTGAREQIGQVACGASIQPGQACGDHGDQVPGVRCRASVGDLAACRGAWGLRLGWWLVDGSHPISYTRLRRAGEIGTPTQLNRTENLSVRPARPGT